MHYAVGLFPLMLAFHSSCICKSAKIIGMDESCADEKLHERSSHLKRVFSAFAEGWRSANSPAGAARTRRAGTHSPQQFNGWTKRGLNLLQSWVGQLAFRFHRKEEEQQQQQQEKEAGDDDDDDDYQEEKLEDDCEEDEEDDGDADNQGPWPTTQRWLSPAC